MHEYKIQTPFEPFLDVKFIDIKDQHVWNMHKDAYFIALSIEVADWREKKMHLNGGIGRNSHIISTTTECFLITVKGRDSKI